MSRINLQRTEGSFSAAPDFIASHIYKEGKQIQNLSDCWTLPNQMWTLTGVKKLFWFDLFGLLIQQSLLISGLKGVECVGVVQRAKSWTATHGSGSISAAKVTLWRFIFAHRVCVQMYCSAALTLRKRWTQASSELANQAGLLQQRDVYQCLMFWFLK